MIKSIFLVVRNVEAENSVRRQTAMDEDWEISHRPADNTGNLTQTQELHKNELKLKSLLSLRPK